MNSIVSFDFESNNVRVITDEKGEPWFVLSDICSVLEHSNPSMAASRLDDDEKGVSNVYTPGGDQKVTIISESGLYSLILTSRKPEAKRFKKWVTSEVLPAIRKTGTYTVPMSKEEMILMVITDLQREVEAQKAAIEKKDVKIEKQGKAIEKLVPFKRRLDYMTVDRPLHGAWRQNLPGSSRWPVLPGKRDGGSEAVA